MPDLSLLSVAFAAGGAIGVTYILDRLGLIERLTPGGEAEDPLYKLYMGSILSIYRKGKHKFGIYGRDCAKSDNEFPCE